MTRLPHLTGIAYLAHPVGGDVENNIARAKRWLHWLSRQAPQAAVIAPWIANIEAGEDDNDPIQRTRGLAKAALVASRCDAIILCGGRVSSGMAIERQAAQARRREVIDLTALGDEPPTEAP